MLSKTCEYALRAITCLAAAHDRPLSANVLAEKTRVPRRYLTRVLQDLAAAEIVVSRSGPGGGYGLMVKPDELTMLDVINAISPIERITTCPLGITSSTHLCPLHSELDRAYAESEAAFSRVTFKSLVDLDTSESRLCPDRAS